MEDYRERLGQAPNVRVPGTYAMWVTDLLNYSINEMADPVGQSGHIGFEDDEAGGFSSTLAINGIE